MWILDFLPEVFIHLLVLVGAVGTIAGFILGRIPFIATYRIPIQVISVLVLALGIYMEGGLSNQQHWKIKVAELEAENARLAEKSAKINTEIVTKIVTKKQIIKQKGEEVIRYIDREVIKYDAFCPIPLPVIAAHDAAAKNATVVDPTKLDAAAKKPKPEIRLPVK